MSAFGIISSPFEFYEICHVWQIDKYIIRYAIFPHVATYNFWNVQHNSKKDFSLDCELRVSEADAEQN